MSQEFVFLFKNKGIFIYLNTTKVGFEFGNILSKQVRALN